MPNENSGRFLKSLRNAFISGFLLLAPVGVTLFVFDFLIRSLGEPTREIFFFYLSDEVLARPGVLVLLNICATLMVLLLITMLGWFSRLLVGRILVQTFERIVNTVPVAKQVYNTVKQIIDTFSKQSQSVFQQVVMVQFPRKGVYAIGFVTSRGRGEVQHRTEANLVNVFVPTTPNPTSGFLIMVPEDEIILLKMSVPDGMKLIISGGAVVPDWYPGMAPETTGPIPVEDTMEATAGNREAASEEIPAERDATPAERKGAAPQPAPKA